jgi:ketosteroid isomerase-like protein
MIVRDRTKGGVMVLRRSVVLMIVACFFIVSPCIAKQKGASGNNDVTALVELHNKAFSAQDLVGVMKTWSSAPNTVLMGSGPGEVYVGEEAIGSAYDQFFNRFDPKSLSFKYDWATVGTSGNVAWFAVTTTIEGSLKNEKKERAFNMSGTLEKKKGKWRIVSMHFSRLGAEQQQDAK